MKLANQAEHDAAEERAQDAELKRSERVARLRRRRKEASNMSAAAFVSTGGNDEEEEEEEDEEKLELWIKGRCFLVTKDNSCNS
jgi:hypothetical protein